MIWTKYAGVLLPFVDRKCFWFCIYYEVFLNICANIPGCVWQFESLCVEFVYIPGCVWNFMSGFLLELINLFKIDFEKFVEFLLRSFRKFQTSWNDLLSLPKMMQKDLLIEALIWWNFRQNDKRNLETIWLLFELENMFLILTPGIIQTPLWRTFDRSSPKDSMDDREVDSR
jgi:hypothetical protein